MTNEAGSEDKLEAAPTTLDKAAIREALAQYQAWNEADFVHRVRTAGQKTTAEKWREYRELYAFARRMKSELSPLAQVMAAQEWEGYYEQLRRFEARRQSRG